MKLSTRLKKYVAPELLFGTGRYSDPNGDFVTRPILLMVDGNRVYKDGCEYKAYCLSSADRYHRYLTKDEHCTLLPINECPVVNDEEIIMHYTSTTYRAWCNQLVDGNA